MAKGKKLLVVGRKGHSYRLLLLSDREPIEYRAMSKTFPQLVVGELLTVTELVVLGDLIEAMKVCSAVKGDSRKKRILISVEEINVGDLIEGVPVLRIGTTFYVEQEKKAYAYFS